MKRFLRHFVAFLALTAVGYVMAICVLGEVFPTYFKKSIRYRRFGGGHLYTRLEEARKVKDIDILFLGTSHCYRGFDTRIFKKAGYRSFNLGSSIQTPLQTQMLLKKFLIPMHPKLVVYEVNPVAFASDGVESSVDVISNDVIDWETIKMAFKVNLLKTYNTLIFALYRQITGFGKQQTEARNYHGDQYVPGGFVQAKLEFYDGKNRFAKEEYKFNSKQWRAFDEILKILKKRNVPYVLIQAPVTKNYYSSKTNNSMFDSIMRLRGTYYNFNNMVRLIDTLDFYDDNHLNQNGVVVFDNKLIDVIKNKRLGN